MHKEKLIPLFFVIDTNGRLVSALMYKVLVNLVSTKNVGEQNGRLALVSGFCLADQCLLYGFKF
jgi:hypothetical protein